MEDLKNLKDLVGLGNEWSSKGDGAGQMNQNSDAVILPLCCGKGRSCAKRQIYWSIYIPTPYIVT